MGVAALMVLVAGCNGSSERGAIGPDNGGPTTPSPSGPGDSTGGTRLKSRVYVADDGTKQWVGWHDSQLGIDCAFVTAADGQTRCLPTGTANGSGYYADDGCSQPVAEVSKGCAAPKLALVADASGGTCATARLRVLAIGSPLTAGNVYAKYNGCTALPVSSAATAVDLYTTGAETPASTYVAATEQVQ